MMRRIDLRPDLNSIDADRMLIRQAASYVRNLWKQRDEFDMNDLYLAAGRELKNLRDHLSKNNSRPDRVDWVRAFKEDTFGCSRRQAERYIAMYLSKVPRR